MTEEKRKSRARHNGVCLQSQGWETEAGVLEVHLSPRPVLTGHKPHLPNRYLKCYLRESPVSEWGCLFPQGSPSREQHLRRSTHNLGVKSWPSHVCICCVTEGS